MTNSQQTLYSMVKNFISSKIRNKTRMSTLSSIIPYSFGSPCHSNQRTKGKKGIQILIQIGKEAKLSLSPNDIILQIEILRILSENY